MSESIRRARPDDRPAILGILRASLGWPADPRAEALWSWKHEQGPWGPSPVWVGLVDAEVVAVRAFLRWELNRPDGSVVRAVRAVDTATHPSQQGRGWFRRLTLHGLEELAAEGVELVFNTPNDQSRPGYLSMGWTEQERLTAWVRVLNPLAVRRIWRARVPADLWPEPLALGQAPAEAFARPGVEALLAAASRPSPVGAATARTPEFYRWRYGLPELGYRVVSGPDGPDAGFAVVRRRRRGATSELAVLDVVGPAWRAVRRGGGDHALALGVRPGWSWLRAPGLGPRLVARPVGDGTVPAVFSLALGDVELL
jgi:hypothetical protein